MGFSSKKGEVAQSEGWSTWYKNEGPEVDNTPKLSKIHEGRCQVVWGHLAWNHPYICIVQCKMLLFIVNMYACATIFCYYYYNN